MAYGMGQTGGVMGTPAVSGQGVDQWSMMSGMAAGTPLAGGYAGSPGYNTTTRKIATAPNSTAAVATGTPGTQNWSQLFNLGGNPLGWILILLIGYVAITHLQIARKLPHIGK
jgi:hypothetical protein